MALIAMATMGFIDYLVQWNDLPGGTRQGGQPNQD
jgi:hypothetical protein